MDINEITAVSSITLLDNIDTKYKQEVFERIKKNAIEKLKTLQDQVQKYQDLQSKYESWVAKGSKGYDVGDYKSELKNALYWYNVHKVNNAELLF